MLFNHVTDVRELCVQILLQVLQQNSPVVPVEKGKGTVEVNRLTRSLTVAQ